MSTTSIHSLSSKYTPIPLLLAQIQNEITDWVTPDYADYQYFQNFYINLQQHKWWFRFDTGAMENWLLIGRPNLFTKQFDPNDEVWLTSNNTKQTKISFMDLLAMKTLFPSYVSHSNITNLSEQEKYLSFFIIKGRDIIIPIEFVLHHKYNKEYKTLSELKIELIQPLIKQVMPLKVRKIQTPSYNQILYTVNTLLIENRNISNHSYEVLKILLDLIALTGMPYLANLPLLYQLSSSIHASIKDRCWNWCYFKKKSRFSFEGINITACFNKLQVPNQSNGPLVSLYINGDLVYEEPKESNYFRVRKIYYIAHYLVTTFGGISKFLELSGQLTNEGTWILHGIILPQLVPGFDLSTLYGTRYVQIYMHKINVPSQAELLTFLLNIKSEIGQASSNINCLVKFIGAKSRFSPMLVDFLEQDLYKLLETINPFAMIKNPDYILQQLIKLRPYLNNITWENPVFTIYIDISLALFALNSLRIKHSWDGAQHVWHERTKQWTSFSDLPTVQGNLLLSAINTMRCYL